MNVTNGPDFMVIGFPKTGTSWLFQMLRQHPHLHMPYPRNNPVGSKEFNVWSNWAAGRDVAGITPQTYSQSFDHDGIRGEVSTNYCFSLDCVDLIRRNLPNVRFIIGLRNPIDAVLSDYYHRIRGGTSIRFDRWLADNASDIRHRFYFDRMLELDAFVYFYEDLAVDPLPILREMFAFIGVEHFEPPATQQRFNARYAWRHRRPHVALLEVLRWLHGTEKARRIVATPQMQSGWVRRFLAWNQRHVDYSAHPGRSLIRDIVEPVAGQTVERYRLDWFD